jgi:uncharacterized protein (TIGR02996 family)
VTDLERLRRAILANPHDDVARLAYADALEETGDSKQAKWVRVGAQLPCIYHAPGCMTPWDCDHTELNPGKKPGGPAWVWKGVLFALRMPLQDFLACAGKVFSAHPITQVDLTDRTPRSDSHGFNWCRLSGLPRDSRLPDELFDLLQGGTLGRVGLPYATYRWYPSADDATDSLSTACVAQGRSLAGLPPLPV